MTIIRPHPAGRCTVSQYERFEAGTGLKLPAEYRHWLLEHNGGRPDPKRMEFVENGIETASDVHWIYGLGGPGWADLADAWITFKGRIPRSCIPIARDSGGNLYLLNTANGAVQFWNHEEETTSCSSMPLCADSFLQFLGRLNSRDE